MLNTAQINFISGSTFITGSDGQISSSIITAKWETDPDDPTSVQLRVPSASFGGADDRIAFYISGSGRVGIGTKDPSTDIDLGASTNEMKIRRLHAITGSFTNMTTTGYITASTGSFDNFDGGVF